MLNCLTWCAGQPCTAVDSLPQWCPATPPSALGIGLLHTSVHSHTAQLLLAILVPRVTSLGPFSASGAGKFDLRFVPDEQSFEGRQVRDAATEVPPDYQPPTFQTKARTISGTSEVSFLWIFLYHRTFAWDGARASQQPAGRLRVSWSRDLLQPRVHMRRRTVCSSQPSGAACWGVRAISIPAND